MPKRTTDRTAPYQSIHNTSCITGCSQGAIRAGCKNGEIPHIKVGKEYRVNVPLFLELLEEKSRESLKLDIKKSTPAIAALTWTGAEMTACRVSFLFPIVPQKRGERKP